MLIGRNRGHFFLIFLSPRAKLLTPDWSSGENTILGDPGAVSRGRVKSRNESFKERAEEPLGTKSHRTISKWLREYRLLIGEKKSLVLFCPIGEQQLSNHFRVFYTAIVVLPYLSGSCTKIMHAVLESFSLITPCISKCYLHRKLTNRKVSKDELKKL